MSLQVWLPLIGDTHNQGCGNYTITTVGTLSWVDGKIGNTAMRAGTGEQVTNGLQLNTNFVDLLNGDYSVAVWVKPYGNHVHYNGSIISSGNWNTANKRWAFGVNQTNTQVDVLCNNYNTYIDCPVPVDTWTHLVCTCGQDRKIKLYKNGSYVGVVDRGTNTIDSDASVTYIGRESYASGYFSFNGAIQDFRLYNNCLSEQEVKEISQGLVLHYQLNRNGWGNPNMITKSMLSTTPWSDAITGTEFYKNKNAILVQNNTLYSKTSNGTTNVFPSMTFEENTQYTLSLDWCDHLRTDSYSSSMYLRFWYTDGTYSQIISPTASTDANWVHQKMTSTAGKTVEMIRTTYGRGGKISIANFKIEKGISETIYSPPIDELGTIEYDSSGYKNNGTRIGTISSDIGTSKYNTSTVFDGNTAAIQTPAFYTMVKDKNYTISVWVNKSVIGTKNYQTIYGGPSGFELEARSSSSTSPLFRILNWGGGTTSYEFNKWNHFCFVHTDSDSKLYVNGELKITGTSAAIPTSGNWFVGAWNTSTSQNFEGKMVDFRIYVTALTANDVLSLYNNGAYIDSAGNIHGKIR